MKNTVIAAAAAVALLAGAQAGFAEDAPTPALATVAATTSVVQPKGQAQLEGVIGELRQGKSDFAQMTPLLRVNLMQVPGMIPSLSTRLAAFGDLKSVTFAGVQKGLEIYDVRFAEASMVWGVAVDDEGKMSGVRWRFH